jgi:hypothetical protein
MKPREEPRPQDKPQTVQSQPSFFVASGAAFGLMFVR